MYKIPQEYFLRIHHCRPRFKSDVENVLLYMAQESVKIPDGSVEAYSAAFNDAIRLYPGNEGLKIKTINNWRTEISSLFGFYIEDKAINYTKTGEMAKVLATQQDLMQFFKYFLFSFQYPGGHLKSHEIRTLIDAGVKFKPAKYIASVLIHGNDRLKGSGKLFSISKAEATHCIFNDLRVTRDHRNPSEVVDLILENRRKKVDYDGTGDVIRYAGDILDYMGDPAVTGKKNGTDLFEGKLTLPVILMLDMVSKEEKQTITDLFTKKERNEKDLEILLSIMNKYNMKEISEKKADEYINMSLNSLDVFENNQYKDALIALALAMVGRNK